MRLQIKQRQNLIQLLVEEFEQQANPKTKKWFENYLKNAIAYRGLKTPQVASLVKEWYLNHNLKQYTIHVQLALCCDLIESSFAEDKFAGTIYLQKYLSKKIDYQELLAECNSWFEQGCFFDWSTTDWFCTRVLDPIIVKNGTSAAEIIAHWRHSENFWQRRASIVSFRHPSADEQYHPLIELIIDDLVREDKRFIQTAIGWVLADMSKKYPNKVEVIFRRYMKQLNKEIIDRHAKHLPCHKELKQLKRRSQ
ncbi:MAG: DNA alkylation repair protein [Pleurocapsa sp.]